MAAYTRNATCTKGHKIELSFEWNPHETAGGPIDYSEPCPVPGCDGRVAGKLPIGTDSKTLKVKP